MNGLLFEPIFHIFKISSLLLWCFHLPEVGEWHSSREAGGRGRRRELGRGAVYISSLRSVRCHWAHQLLQCFQYSNNKVVQVIFIDRLFLTNNHKPIAGEWFCGLDLSVGISIFNINKVEKPLVAIRLSLWRTVLGGHSYPSVVRGLYISSLYARPCHRTRGPRAPAGFLILSKFH